MNIIKKALLKVLAKGSSPMIKHMFLTTGDFSKAFYEKTGHASLPVMDEITNKCGIGFAEITRKMMKIESMKDISESYEIMSSILELGVEPIESSNNMSHFKITRCPYGLEKTDKELCEVMMVADKKMVSTLLGQEVEMKIIQSLAAGDKNCEVVFSK